MTKYINYFGFRIKREFLHPEIDSRATRVEYEDNNGIVVKLFSVHGEIAVDDIENRYVYYPGLRLVVLPDHSIIHLDRIYLKPKFRRKGIGSKFLEKLGEIGRDAGLDKIVLCPDEKTEAKVYWAKMGFNDIKGSKNMELRL